MAVEHFVTFAPSESHSNDVIRSVALKVLLTLMARSLAPSHALVLSSAVAFVAFVALDKARKRVSTLYLE